MKTQSIKILRGFLNQLNQEYREIVKREDEFDKQLHELFDGLDFRIELK